MQRPRLVAIAQHHGLDVGAGHAGRLEQLVEKGLELTAIGGGAFREEQHGSARAQMRRHLRGHAVGVARAALDVQRPRRPGQMPHDWPVRHFRLGEETDRKMRADHRDVHPGHMIADPKRRSGIGLAMHADFQVQHPAHASMPIADDGFLEGQVLDKQGAAGNAQHKAGADMRPETGQPAGYLQLSHRRLDDGHAFLLKTE